MKTKILTLIAHMSKSIVAVGFKLGESIVQSSAKHTGNLVPHPPPVWAWQAIASMWYEIGHLSHLFKKCCHFAIEACSLIHGSLLGGNKDTKLILATIRP